MRLHLPNKGLVKTIQECSATCEHMTKMMLYMPDVKNRVEQINLLRDCADICDTTEDYVARNSYFSKSIAAQCADICVTCGTECSKFPDQASQMCAQICFNCAEECKEFSYV